MKHDHNFVHEDTPQQTRISFTVWFAAIAMGLGLWAFVLIPLGRMFGKAWLLPALEMLFGK